MKNAQHKGLDLDGGDRVFRVVFDGLPEGGESGPLVLAALEDRVVLVDAGQDGADERAIYCGVDVGAVPPTPSAAVSAQG